MWVNAQKFRGRGRRISSMWKWRRHLVAFLACCVVGNCIADESRFFTSSDGVRLHYLEEGGGETLLFVPGWLMPAEIWRRQIDHFARHYRVIAFDPRSQGDSQQAASGNNIRRRSDDLNELIAHLRSRRVVLIGWSLGVLEALMYVKTYGDDKVAALVLVDNSVGEFPPQKGDPDIKYLGPRDRRREMATFVGSMFKSSPPAEYLAWLTEQTLRAPPRTGASLLVIPYSGAFWRSAVYETQRPLFYAVTASLRGQAETLQRKRKDTYIEIFPQAGHALFVDEYERFNLSLDAFLEKSLSE
jgi:non-heme chloroperoxidase